MKTYKEMTWQELGEAYDNTSAVAESAELLGIFEQKSELVRKAYSCINMKYGAKERQNIDYFHIKDNAPIFVFIHGGYWQMRRKETFHFIVEFIAKQGLNVAFIGYTLAPENDIAGIENDISLALEALRQANLNFDKGKIILSGWSAGGHLCVEMLQEKGVISALAISGIYDLEPISMCFLNDKLNISNKDIRELSPIYKTFSKKINLVYGSDELPEIIRQSKDFHKLCNSSIKPIKDANHFSVLLNADTFAL